MTRRWLTVLACALIGLVAAGLYLLVKPATYTATAHNLVTPEAAGEVVRTEAVSFATALGRVADSPAVIAQPLRAVGLSLQPEELRQRVRISVSPDAPLIEVNASAQEPEEAALLANTISTALATYADQRRQETGVRAAQFTTATPPEEPSGPRRTLTLVVGLLLGLLVGGAFALLPRRPEASSL